MGDALRLAFEMFWVVLWPLAIGFLLSACVETFVSTRAISRALCPASRFFRAGSGCAACCPA